MDYVRGAYQIPASLRCDRMFLVEASDAKYVELAERYLFDPAGFGSDSDPVTGRTRPGKPAGYPDPTRTGGTPSAVCVRPETAVCCDCDAALPSRDCMFVALSCWVGFCILFCRFFVVSDIFGGASLQHAYGKFGENLGTPDTTFPTRLDLSICHD